MIGEWRVCGLTLGSFDGTVTATELLEYARRVHDELGPDTIVRMDEMELHAISVESEGCIVPSVLPGKLRLSQEDDTKRPY